MSDRICVYHKNREMDCKENNKYITSGVHFSASDHKSPQESSQIPLDDEEHLPQFYFLILEASEHWNKEQN